MAEMNSSALVSVEPTSSRANREQEPAVSGSEQTQLAARFLIGLLLHGGDELLKYLQETQRETAVEAPGYVVSGKATERDLVTYLALGILAQGQKGLVRGIRRGVHYSAGVARWAFGAMDRLTDNPLGRPFRGPIESWLSGLVQEGERVVREGRREAQGAKLLASRALGVIARDVVAGVADSPAVTETIQLVVGQQGAQLTGSMMDSARQLSTSADSAAEGVARRLFRRRPRHELPPSPLAGKPQMMYLSWKQPEEGEKDGQ